MMQLKMCQFQYPYSHACVCRGFYGSSVEKKQDNEKKAKKQWGRATMGLLLIYLSTHDTQNQDGSQNRRILSCEDLDLYELA